MRRRRWRIKRAMTTLILVSIALGGVALFPPSAWRDVEDTVRRQAGSVENMIRPAAQRTVDWLDRQTWAARDWFTGLDRVAAATEPSDEKSIRIGRGPATLSGSARVVDGDTLAMDGVRVRLHGIDAPESSQSCRTGGRSWPCGREATRALARLIANRPVACEEQDRDRYGRVVAVCNVAGLDVNAWMVAEGWALAYRRYSRAYVAQESRARAARRGVWGGEIVAPWEWRKGKRLEGARPAAQRDTGRCNIKGNIGTNGARIYHVPGGRYYEQTRIDTSKGERWFCTESEARGSGWRRSRQ